MKEDTKENSKEDIELKEKNKKGKKATLGDIIFRILILISIFFIAVISYVFYIQEMNGIQVITYGDKTKNSIRIIKYVE